MGRIVRRYGGSSVVDTESIKHVTRRIARIHVDGYEVIIVISAMGGATDELMDLALKVSPNPKSRGLGMLLTMGERQSAALLAMALADLGIKAVSHTGSQAGILTTPTYGNARVIDIILGRVVRSLEEDNVVIVAGFQGMVQTIKDVTTLGRGVSGTTAVALTSALGANHYEIYTDVDGIHTAGPRIVPSTRRITEIDYEEMMELAASGAKILRLRCIEYARYENVKVHVRSSLSDKSGTWVEPRNEVRKADKMEEVVVTGMAHDHSEVKTTVIGVLDQVGAAALIFEIILNVGIDIDMIVQNVSELSNVKADISFTLPMSDGRKGIEALEANKNKTGFEEVLYDDQIGKVSVVGAGMRSHSGMTTTFFKVLAIEGANPQVTSTSEIRVSVVINTDEVGHVVRGAYAAFGLDGEEEVVVYAGTGR